MQNVDFCVIQNDLEFPVSLKKLLAFKSNLTIKAMVFMALDFEIQGNYKEKERSSLGLLVVVSSKLYFKGIHRGR